MAKKNTREFFLRSTSNRQLVVLKLVKNVTVHIQFFDDLWSGIKLRTRNITKILFCKNINDSCGQKWKLSNHYETA